jgi:hypothetical protein
LTTLFHKYCEQPAPLSLPFYDKEIDDNDAADESLAARAHTLRKSVS